MLSTSSYQNGIRATLFAFEDKGIAYLRGDGADTLIVRTVVGLDAPRSEKVALQARRAREAAGLLTGHAAGEVMRPRPIRWCCSTTSATSWREPTGCT